MRVLVTGATGLVGRAVAASLAARGDRVIGLSRDARAARRAIPSLHDAYDWADASVPPPGEALAEARAIVHLAGEPVAGRWNEAKRRAIEESRVLGTRSLVTALERTARRPEVLVSASAMGLYGSRGEDELGEEEPEGEGFLAKVCGGWEREACRAEELGVRVVRLRIALVLAKDGGALEQMRRLFRMGLGGRLGSGRQWWAWIHLEDLVGLVLHAIDTPELSGAINASAPGVARQAEFASVLARVMHRPAFLPTPELALKLSMSGFADELLASRRLSAKRALESGYCFRFEALEPALRDLI